MARTEILLTGEQKARFDLSLQRRSAIMEAGETMAKNFAQQMDEAMTEVNKAYELFAEGNPGKVDLVKERWEYDAPNGRMVLTQKTY